MKRASLTLAALVLLVASGGLATADTINFSSYATGTAITNLDGITFSLIGGPDSSGPPLIGYDDAQPTGLTNSTNPDYPTANILDFKFSGPVSGVSFTFNDYGSDPYGSGSYYQAFAGATLLEQGNVTGSDGSTVFTLTASGITDLQFANGTGGSNSWYFAVPMITFTAASVPEPATFTMFGIGIVGVAGYQWRQRRKVAAS